MTLPFRLRSPFEAGSPRDHRVTVFGVFTRSLTAPFSDADTVHRNDRLNYVSAMRRREDEELLKLVPGLRMIDLNLKDAPLRLRCEAEDVYTIVPNPNDTAIAKIHKALQKLSAEQEIDAFLLPLGLGHHVDHLVVRDAATAFCVERPVAFYEDLPDALRSQFTIEKAAEIELRSIRESGSPEEDAIPVIVSETAIDDAVIIKRRVISVYASQIDEATIDAVGNLTRECGGERIWASPGWLKPPSKASSV